MISPIEARHQAEEDLARLGVFDRLRIYAGGVRTTERWLAERTTHILERRPRVADTGRPLAMQLRLDSLRKDGVGWKATFYGKPDVVGNSLTVPISAEHAERLEVGGQVLFVEKTESGASEKTIRGGVDPRALSYYAEVSLDTALAIARERIEEWSYDDDPHGYCHERPVLMRLVQTIEDALV